MSTPIDVLDRARQQVLEGGRGLDRADVLACLMVPDTQLPDLLALAHDVRLRWCGDEVEVEGIVSVKTGGCPEDCHFCSQSGLFESPVRAAQLDVPSMVQAAREMRETGATRVSFKNPNWRSQITCMPLKTAVKMMLMPMMPGARKLM